MALTRFKKALKLKDPHEPRDATETDRVKRAFKGWLLAACAVLGFLVVITYGLTPPVPEERLPASQRLSALITRQQGDIREQKQAVEDLRAELQQTETGTNDVALGLVAQERAIKSAAQKAGAVSMRGEGFTVTLNDSTLAQAPSGNVNDLVIHSQDVQAVVNALWASGAEAIAINGERVVSTSAILCVGNTLLLNGTVHAPPYEVSAIGADRAKFNNDPSVKRLAGVAQEFSLRFSIGRTTTVTVPRYNGALNFRYALPTDQPLAGEDDQSD